VQVTVTLGSEEEASALSADNRAGREGRAQGRLAAASRHDRAAVREHRQELLRHHRGGGPARALRILYVVDEVIEMSGGGSYIACGDIKRLVQ
jgi:hypothetical protein